MKLPKYSGALEVKKPLAQVVAAFANPDYLGHYQDGFIAKELLSGEAGQAGAVSVLRYRYGKQQMELVETIHSNQLPLSFSAHYQHKHMENTMLCRFRELSADSTSYEYEYEYTRMSFVPRVLGLLFPNMYRKQGEKWLRQFKDFVEGQD